MLQNLHELGAQLQEAYVKNYPVKDKALPTVFKQLVKDIDGATVEYNEYSFIVTITSSAQKIFFPNQLLYVAACFADYYKALSEYARMIKTDLRISDSDIKQAKDNKEYAQELLVDAILEEGDKELLAQFLSDYNWWYGGKGIERADYYISPILSLSKLVNASQSYVADLCRYLARNEKALQALKDEISSINIDSSTTRQIIYYGAPGTGKSHEVKKQTGELLDSGEKRELPNVFRTTFHPDTDYASFVGCYKPTMKPTTNAAKTLSGKEEEIVYEYVPQVFADAYVYAYQNPSEQTYLVIEEINRGNCAQIFGDLFQLLDRKDGKSEYTIKADKDLAKYLEDVLGVGAEGIQDRKLCLPANLHILATMNTSDQSLFPMDSAFKRRWEWEYVPINYAEDIKSGTFDINIDGKTYSWVDFIGKVNKKIFDLTQSEDKQMGNFFIKHSVDEKEFKSKVMFYLWYEVLRDETGNNKYFFCKKESADSKDVAQFTFKDLYESDASKTIHQFMTYLGVSPK